MQITGSYWKDNKHWVIECPTLAATTQGRTKKEAFSMMVDWIRTMVEDPKLPMEIISAGQHNFKISFPYPVPVIALITARARRGANMTLAEVAKVLGSKSPNAVHQYETGNHDPSIQKLNDLLKAMGFELVISVVKSDSHDLAG